jgi:DNA-binding NarL/FixJ family response regulator
MRVFVVDPHGIYRRGVAACVREFNGVTEVLQAETAEAALEHVLFDRARVTIVDPWLLGGVPIVRDLVEATSGQVIALSARREPQDVLEVIQAGALGYLWKETLTSDALCEGISSAMRGAGVLAPELLDDFMRGLARVSRDLLEPRGLSLSILTPREVQILSCLAEGYATRETAERLHFSERTVKSALHDVVLKLNVRSRTQAVAEAVRQGLI